MKQILFLLLVPPAFAQAQSDPPKQSDTMLLKVMALEVKKDAAGIGSFEFVQDVPGGKDTLFARAKMWVFNTYKSGKSVIQMEDKADGVIILNGFIGGLDYNNMGMHQDAGGFKHQITLRFKDGRYKCLVSSITYDPQSFSLAGGADITEDFPSNWPKLGKNYNKKQWAKFQKQGITDLKATVLSLSAFMSKVPDESRW